MTLTNKQQVESIISILLANGRASPAEDKFLLEHDDVMMLLEIAYVNLSAIVE